MYLVNRDWRIWRLPFAARGHPGVVVPALMVRLWNDRRGARRRFGLTGDGISLPRRVDATRTDDVIFIAGAWRDARHE